METDLNIPSTPMTSGLERSSLRVFPLTRHIVTWSFVLLATKAICTLLATFLAAVSPMKTALVALAAVGLLIWTVVQTLLVAGFWSIIGRLMHQPARLVHHVMISLIAGLLTLGVGIGMKLIEFALDWERLSFFMVGMFLLGSVAVIWSVSAHLHLATAAASKKIWAGVTLFVVVLGALVGFGYHTARVHLALDTGTFSSLFPPMFKLARSEDVDHHLARLDKLEKIVNQLALAGKN